MIKGCQRKIIYIKNTESDIFEEAYFIIRKNAASEKKGVNESDMISEASKIIGEGKYFLPYRPQAKKAVSSSIKLFSAGVVSAAAVIGIFALVAFLI